MRWGPPLAAAIAFTPFLVARAHARPPVKADFVCTADGKDVDTHRALDHDITCRIDHPSTPALTAEVSVDSVLPFGSSAPIVRTNGVFTSGKDFLRCADSKFHGVLRDGVTIVWNAVMFVHPTCPRPRVKPQISCAETSASTDLPDDMAIADGTADVLSGPPAPHHAVLRCTISIGHTSPKGLRVSFLRRDKSAPTTIGTSDADLTDDGNGGATAFAELSPDVKRPIGSRDRTCPAVVVAAVLWTHDGALLWSGQTSHALDHCD